MRTRVKICGITSLEDAAVAVDKGADALGFVFAATSPRFIKPARAREIASNLPPFVTTVGVFVNESVDEINRVVGTVGLGCVQLHGEEAPEVIQAIRSKVIKAVRVQTEKDLEGLERYCADAYILDTYVEGIEGGTGETFDWAIALKAKRFGPIILAGGLTPENVADAISSVRPYAVDVSTGVEREPGRKDPEKVGKFIDMVRGI